MSALKVSLRLNNDVPASELIEVARLAELHGFDQLWVSNDLFLRSAPALLGRLSAHTERLQLGTGILNPHTMHTSEIAMFAATMQELTDGRFLLGIGAGAAEFLGWVGLERPRPLSATRRALVELHAALHGEQPPGWDSAAYLRFSATPAPVYVGAMGPKMLALAGELADGALPLLYPPEHYAESAAQIAAGAQKAGRDPDALDVAACFWVSVHDDPATAARPLAEKIAYYGASFSPVLLDQAGVSLPELVAIQALVSQGRLDEAVARVTPDMLALGIAGDADEVVRRCQGLLGQGARHLSFGPPLGPDRLAAIELLGSQVLPRIRAAATTV